MKIIVKSIEIGMDWHLDIVPPTEKGDRYKIEGIRKTDKEIIPIILGNKPTEFEDYELITGERNGDSPCTIVYPRLNYAGMHNVSAKSTGNKLQIVGNFRYFVDDLAITDIDERIFSKIRIPSKHLEVFIGENIIKTFYKNIGKNSNETHTFSGKQLNCLSLKLEGIGVLKLLVKPVSKNTENGILMSQEAIIECRFQKKKSLREIIEFCFHIEWLFAFFIGHFDGIDPVALFRKKNVNSRDGTLNFSGIKSRKAKLPSYFDAILTIKELEKNIKNVLETYLLATNRFIHAIQAVEFSRSLSSDLVSIFSFIMPVLEEILDEKYRGSDEILLEEKKSKFISFIEGSGDDELNNFLLKNVTFETKNKGLKQWFDEAIEQLKTKGFNFPNKLSRVVVKRRGNIFHKKPNVNDGDEFYLEVEAVTIILMLLTFQDLGIDISAIAKERIPYNEIRKYITTSV